MGLAFVHYEAAEPIRLPYIDKWAPNSGQEHFAKDDLVAWAWNPGLGREPAPGTKVRGLPGGWLLPESRFKDFKQPEPYLPRCERPDHYTEWVRQAKAGKKSITPIEFACGLTEFALLGTLAQRRYTMPVGATGGAGRGRRLFLGVLARRRSPCQIAGS